MKRGLEIKTACSLVMTVAGRLAGGRAGGRAGGQAGRQEGTVPLLVMP